MRPLLAVARLALVALLLASSSGYAQAIGGGGGGASSPGSSSIPSQTGHANQVLGTNGSAASWATASVAQGANGITSYAVGDILYADTTSSLHRLTVCSSTQVYLGGSIPTCGQVILTSMVTGTLPVGNGGLGIASFTAGDLLYASGATTLSKLAAGTSSQVLVGGTTPAWTNPQDVGGVDTATTTLSFAGSTRQTISISADTTFASSNLAAGRSITLRIVCDGTTRALAFPAGWTFMGAGAPVSIGASKTAILSLVSYSTTDANVVASYVVQP